LYRKQPRIAHRLGEDAYPVARRDRIRGDIEAKGRVGVRRASGERLG
jgi:hypothetical protein